MKQTLKILFALAMAAVTLWGYSVPPAANFPNHELARMIFFHLPCAISTCWFVFLAPYLAVRCLLREKPHRPVKQVYFPKIWGAIVQTYHKLFVRHHSKAEWDMRSASCNELGFLFAILTMATGILFSRVQWGAWWNWDPRQTSFLFVLLIYGAYFALRAAIGDEGKRAANSAAYSLATTLPVLFLIFVLPRVLFSLHPSTTLLKNELEGDYKKVFYASLVLFTALAAWLYQLRVRAGLAELALENLNGKLEADGGAAAPTGVVRPVPVSRES